MTETANRPEHDCEFCSRDGEEETHDADCPNARTPSDSASEERPDFNRRTIDTLRERVRTAEREAEEARAERDQIAVNSLREHDALSDAREALEEIAGTYDLHGRHAQKIAQRALDAGKLDPSDPIVLWRK